MSRSVSDAELLARLIEDVERGRDVDDALAEHPDRRAELEPLLRLAAGIRASADAVAPDSLARVRVRRRLLATMAATPALRPQVIAMPRWWRRPIWSVAAMLIFFLALGSSTAIQAAQDAMPGEPLFPLRVAVEDLQVALAPTDNARAEVALRIADREVATIARAAEAGLVEAAAQLSERYEKTVERARALSEEVQQPALAVQLQRHQQVLEAVASQASAPAATAIARALAASAGATLAPAVVEPTAAARVSTPGLAVPAGEPTVADTATAIPPTVLARATRTPDEDDHATTVASRDVPTPQPTATNGEPADVTPAPTAKSAPRPAETALPERTPEPAKTPEPAETPSASVTAQPSASVDPTPDDGHRGHPGKTPEPTTVAVASPAAPTPVPSVETVQPGETPTPVPSDTPRPDPTARPKDEPRSGPTARPQDEPRPEPTARPTEPRPADPTPRADDEPKPKHTPDATARPEKPDDKQKGAEDIGPPVPTARPADTPAPTAPPADTPVSANTPAATAAPDKDKGKEKGRDGASRGNVQGQTPARP